MILILTTCVIYLCGSYPKSCLVDLQVKDTLLRSRDHFEVNDSKAAGASFRIHVDIERSVLITIIDDSCSPAHNTSATHYVG